MESLFMQYNVNTLYVIQSFGLRYQNDICHFLKNWKCRNDKLRVTPGLDLRVLDIRRAGGEKERSDGCADEKIILSSN